jgi:drug/metabolite transporter (DMT)-like permease
MTLFWLSMALVVGMNLVYHLAQKSIAPGVHPLVSVCVSYLVALAATICLFPFFPVRSSLGQALRQLKWPTVAVGLSIVGIEIGFLLAYRYGWRISVGSTVAASALAVLLVPTGLAFYGERLSAANVAGIALCLAGLALAVQR